MICSEQLIYNVKITCNSCLKVIHKLIKNIKLDLTMNFLILSESVNNGTKKKEKNKGEIN